MSRTSPMLSREAVDLLLELLELPEPVLSAQAFELRAPAAARLVAAGLLVPADHEEVTTLVGEHEDPPIVLTWSEDKPGLSYFSSAGGLVTVPAEQLLRRAVSIDETLARLMSGIDVSRGRPTELIGGTLWEIGDARLCDRRARVPIWFVRRLWDRAVLQQVLDAGRRRPNPRYRALLTSSRSARVHDVVVPGAAVVSIRDVLEQPESLAISADILDARIRPAVSPWRQRSARATQAGPAPRPPRA